MRNPPPSALARGVLLSVLAGFAFPVLAADASAPRDLTGFSGMYPYHTNTLWPDAVIASENSALSRRAAPLVVDLARGTQVGACNSGVRWTGPATYVNSDVGTLQYWGMGRGCHPTGLGTLQYADGSLYFGTVETLLYQDSGETDDIRLLPNRVRVAVRQGVGQFQDARSGRMMIGRWQDDRLVADLSGDASFMQALNAVAAAVPDRSAPTYSAALIAWRNWEPVSAAVAAQPAVRNQDADLRRAFAARGEFLASTARDLTRVPDVLLEAWPELAALAPVLERYGSAPWKTPPVLAQKFLGGVKCPTSEGADADWSLTEPSTAYNGGIETQMSFTQPSLSYRGGHEACYAQGSGQIAEPAPGGTTHWLGQVTTLRMREEGLVSNSLARKILPVPDGLGELRLPNGNRVFARATYELPERKERTPMFGVRKMRVLGIARADGSILVFKDQAPGFNYLEGEKSQALQASARALTGAFPVVWHHPNGAIIQTGMNMDGTLQHDTKVFEIPELGLRIEESAGKEWQESRQLKLQIGQAFVGLAPGNYFLGPPAQPRGIPIEEGLRLLDGRLIPADGATATALAALPDPTGNCPDERVRDQVPPNWAVAWASCTPSRVRFVSPNANYYVNFAFDKQGQVTGSTLVRYFGMGGANWWQAWTPETWTIQGDQMIPQGLTTYDVVYGERGSAGESGLYYRGPMGGFRPHGSGECRIAGTKDWERCDFDRGKRVDSVYLERAQRYAEQQAQLAEQRRLAQAESDRRERAERERERLEQERLQAEADAQERRRRAEEAEDAAESQRSWAKTMADLQRSVAEGNARMAETQRISQGYIDQANQAARAQAEQDRRNREEQQRRDREAAEGNRAYAEAQARNAAAKVQAEAAYQQQRQADQARAQAAANDAARRAAGAYGSSSSGSSSSGAGSFAGARAPVPGSCMQEVNRKFGGHCNNPRSVTVYVKNVCDSPIDIRICIGTPSGDRCETSRADPGETVSQWQCELSGGVSVSGTAAN